MLKQTILAALAAATVAAGAGGVADAAPYHLGPHAGGFQAGPVFRGGPVVRGGPVFRGGPGFYPAAYQRWAYGSFVPRAWLVPGRFIVDFGYYNLAAPPPNFEWVQDGPDALLVNVYTGMVVQVVPGAFA